ncbi:YggT family protein [Tepidiforma sp.]|uniref:YggT family protein n=1 Tax=Tepidiforma sp. TaxID=2682230 RepID=UPI002ADDBE6F|nr:YggT family protein [Tepidiforma sp.]
MNDSVAQLFTLFLWLLIVAVFLRSLLSWFPVSQDNEVARLLYRVTEPLLDPVRRVLPRTGMIDFSGMVVIILLYVMIAVVERAAAQ